MNNPRAMAQNDRRLMRRPPKYVQGFIDRHGKARFYFRRVGFKAVALPGLPWSPDFMAAYEVAIAGQPTPIASQRVQVGHDPGARRLATSTQSVLQR